jgi:ERI1 exoribonuclease 2
MKFIVLDFEATCVDPGNPSPQEIIEFPSLLMDGATRSIAKEFQLP